MSELLDLQLTPPSAEPVQQVNILLVDDEPANLLVLQALLQDLGANLIEARGGVEALYHLQDCEFAVVLLDVQMSGIDGLETARRIRSHQRHRHTPIIFITGYDEPAIVEPAYALGAVDYLVKPLVRTILRAKVLGFIELFQKTEQIKWQATQLRDMERREFIRKLAEENSRLRESEQRFRTLASFAPVGIFQTDSTGRCEYVNERWTAMAGLTPDQAKGDGWQRALHVEDRDRVSKEWHDAAHSMREFKSEYRFQTSDGCIVWLHGTAVPLRDEQDQVVGYIGTITDITDRKIAETEQIEAAQHKDEFLATLAHELRNPLAPISNAVQLLRMGGGDPGVLDHGCSVIQRQLQHMVRLVDDLLDVSRITRNKLELRKQTVDLASVISSAVETSRPLIDGFEHQLTVVLPSEPIQVEADAVRLAQVFANLLNNAAKYTGRCGTISLMAEMVTDTAVVKIRDNGIGIAADRLSQVFDMFVQLDQSLERAQGGLGIGLTLVKRLVLLHGGAIEMRSQGPGTGTEVVVCLPIST